MSLLDLSDNQIDLKIASNLAKKYIKDNYGFTCYEDVKFYHWEKGEKLKECYPENPMKGDWYLCHNMWDLYDVFFADKDPTNTLIAQVDHFAMRTPDGIVDVTKPITLKHILDESIR